MIRVARFVVVAAVVFSVCDAQAVVGWEGAEFNTAPPPMIASDAINIGGCCNNGVCTETTELACSGTFLGVGSTCFAAVTRQQGGSTTPFTDPNHNCCEQTSTYGDCCEDTPYCAGDASANSFCTGLDSVGTNCGSMFCEFYLFDFVCSEAGGDEDCGQGAIAGTPCGTAGTCGVACGGAAGDNCSSMLYCAGVEGNPPCELVCSTGFGLCTGKEVGDSCGFGTCQFPALGSTCFGSGVCTQSTCVQPTCQFCTGPVVHSFDVLGAPTTVCSISGAVCDPGNFNGGVCDCPQNIDSCNYVCAADSGANTGNPCSLATQATDCLGGTCGVLVAGENEFCVTGLPLITKSITGTRPFKDDPQSTGLVRIFDFDDGDQCTLNPTDPGIYEVFEVNDFSRVTLDLCCKNPVFSMPYTVLFEACNCSGFDFILPNVGQGGFGNTGLFPVTNNKADIRCEADTNLSMTFDLPAGRYAYPIQADRSCNVTTDTNCDDNTDCPAGEQCVGQVERDYQMHITVAKAQRAACCTGTFCQVVTKLACEGNDQLPTASPYFPGGPNSVVLGGNWLGSQGPEDAIVDTTVADCTVNICSLGACCGGGGVGPCDDTPNGGMAGDGIDEATCAARTGGQGVYQGGVRCADDLCQTCASLEFTDCQQSFNSISSSSDRHHEFRVADDFIPLTGTINRICWSGVWGGQEGGVNCNDDPPDDTWYLTIYNDDGHGLPDMNNIVIGPELPFTHDGRTIVELQPAFKPTTYTAPVMITGLVPNTNCYWIEIQGEGTGDLHGNEACSWNWMRTDTSSNNQGEAAESGDGNGWSASVAANHPAGYVESNLRRSDRAWCADSGIVKNTTGNEGIDGGCGRREGTFACCYRDQLDDLVCTSTVSLFECILGPADNGLAGTVFTGQICADGGGTFACSPPVNDDCVTGATIIDQSTCTPVTNMGNCAKNKASWCRPLASVCPNGDGNCIPIKDANQVQSDNQFDCDIVQTDNRFATTDGPPDMNNATVPDDCSGSSNGGGPFRADVWWKVVAPCSGVMSISMCGGNVYDAMMAAYTQCPDGNDNSAPDLLNCNDDACGSFSTVSEVTPFPVAVDDEVTIRIGGWSPAGAIPNITAPFQGQSQLHLRFACTCPALGKPEFLNGEASFSKDRYLSFDPTANGSQHVAIRVSRVGGAEKFVDCTSVMDLGSDGHIATLIDGPLPPPGDPIYYCDWSSVTNGLHVRGCSVVPGNTYDLAMTIDGSTFTGAGSGCEGNDFELATTPPQFVAGRQFGDLVGSFVGLWTAPDGIVTTNDIVAVVKKFSLDPSAPFLARVDTDGVVPNGIIAGNDILRAVLGFAGGDFGFGVTNCLSGTCVPSCP